jgi:hypothetical protein
MLIFLGVLTYFLVSFLLFVGSIVLWGREEGGGIGILASMAIAISAFLFRRGVPLHRRIVLFPVYLLPSAFLGYVVIEWVGGLLDGGLWSIFAGLGATLGSVVLIHRIMGRVWPVRHGAAPPETQPGTGSSRHDADEG